MFCQKCGKEIENNAMFCPNCGGQTNGGNTVQPNYGASYTAVKKPVPLKYIVIPVAILAVAAIVITVLVLTLNSGSSQQGGPSNFSQPGGDFSQPGGNFSQPGGNSSQPAQSKQLTMTINGENIPVVLSGFAYGEMGTGYGHMAVFVGRKGTELYGVQAIFLTEEDPNCPSSNATYNPLSSRYNDTVAVMFSYMDPSNGAQINADTISSSSGFRSAQISVGEFKPNEKLELSFTGKVSDEGLSFDFSVSGSLEFYNNPQELLDKINSIARSY